MLPKGSNVRLLIYTFHIPLFFVVSGAVDYIKERKRNENKRKSFWIWMLRVGGCDLVVWYFLCTLLYLLFDIIVRFAIQHRIGIKACVWLIYKSMVLHGINVLWFIPSMFITRVVFSQINQLKRAKKEWINIISSIIVMIASCIIVGYFSPMIITMDNSLEKVIMYPLITLSRVIMLFPFFTFGYFISPILMGVLQFSQVKLCVFLCVFGSLWYWIASNVGNVDINTLRFGNNLGLFYTGAIMGSLFVIIGSIILYRIGVNKMILLWGTNSLFIMVTHEYLEIGELIDFFIEKVHIYSKYCLFVKIVLMVFVETLMCKIVAPIIYKRVLQIKRQLYSKVLSD